jgi:hypothetical protein
MTWESSLDLPTAAISRSPRSCPAEARQVESATVDRPRSGRRRKRPVASQVCSACSPSPLEAGGPGWGAVPPQRCWAQDPRGPAFLVFRKVFRKVQVCPVASPPRPSPPRPSPLQAGEGRVPPSTFQAETLPKGRRSRGASSRADRSASRVCSAGRSPQARGARSGFIPRGEKARSGRRRPPRFWSG